jgi:hypothetical protein
MTNRNHPLVAFVFAVTLVAGFVLAGASSARATDTDAAKTPQCTEEELEASVPALHDLHEVVYPLWHTAYPGKDFELIKKLLPQADELTVKLDKAKLPGILRDKQPAWDEGKATLKAALASLHSAADTDNGEEMLKQTEAFHSAFEKLVRTIRPIVPELEAFHQELYKLYHYYAPEYDLEKIRVAVAAMQEKIPPLKKAELPKRVADRKNDFDASISALETELSGLAEVVKTDEKAAILEAVEELHAAYVRTLEIFEKT